MNPTRRQTLTTALGLMAGAALPRLANAQSPYPDGVVKFVIPTPAGGGADGAMRIIGQKLTESWGNTAIVESRPGATGAIAIQAVAKAPPDGLTLLYINSGLLTNLVLQPTPGYKLADLAPVCMLVLTPIAIGVRTSLGVGTLKEYVALAKSKPGKLTFGSYGQGSGGHFVGELLNLTAGIETLHVPYKGEAPAIQDLIGGQIDAAITSIGGVAHYPGRILPLALSSAGRFPLYKDVPTFAEAGFPAVDMPGWGAIYVPARTPKAVVDKLSAELNRIVMLPDVAAKMLEFGFESVAWSPAKLTAFTDQQLPVIRKLVDSGRVKV
ncbi:MAG TPA: tripartite tricarboxylate transporter substrate binding protein [Burkholderiaceae bacterium]|jgi:tripartite-type tricarboxylate transporter receptor subunit TctC